MNCEDVESLLDERRAGRLSAEAERALEAHLRTCPDCGRSAADEEEAAAAVRAAVDALPLDPEFVGSVMGGVREDHRRYRRRGMALVGAGALGAAAAVLLAVALLRAPEPVRVDATEGGLLRVAASSWRTLAEGDRIEAGAWVLTFPDRRASLEVGEDRVLVQGDTLVGLAPGRIDLLRGSLLVTAGRAGCRIETPYGGAEATSATVGLALRYDREPVIRLGPSGVPERTGALLLLAAATAPAAAPPPPPGHVEITAVEGEVSWFSGDRRGRLVPGQRVRLGPAEEEPAEAAPGGGREDWMDRPFDLDRKGEIRLRPGEDALEALDRGLGAATPAMRLAAARGLGRLCGRADAADAAAARLSMEKDPAVRVALIDALQGLGAADHAGPIGEAMRAPWPEVRERALEAWIALRGRDGVERVGQMIDDPEPRLRILALQGLRRLGDPAGRRWAEMALEDDDPSVEAEAERTLRALGQ